MRAGIRGGTSTPVFIALGHGWTDVFNIGFANFSRKITLSPKRSPRLSHRILYLITVRRDDTGLASWALQAILRTFEERRKGRHGMERDWKKWCGYKQRMPSTTRSWERQEYGPSIVSGGRWLCLEIKSELKKLKKIPLCCTKRPNLLQRLWKTYTPLNYF